MANQMSNEQPSKFDLDDQLKTLRELLGHMGSVTRRAGYFENTILESSRVHQELYSCQTDLANSKEALAACESKFQTENKKKVVELHLILSKNLKLIEELAESEDIRSKIEEAQRGLEIKVEEKEGIIAFLERQQVDMEKRHQATCDESARMKNTICELEKALGAGGAVKRVTRNGQRKCPPRSARKMTRNQ